MTLEQARLEQVSKPARLAEPGEGIGLDELGLAARNHALPLEALRYDVTPPGLHYVLVHYDIPLIEAGEWRLHVDGLVDRPLQLNLESLRAMAERTVRVTMECAGNGRARLEPRPISQPWLTEAVGTADWTGVRLADVLDRAGLSADAAEIVFTGADHGVERGVEQDYQRSLTPADALGDDVLLAYAMNGQPLPPQHGFPVRLIVPGWYGMAHVKWLTRVTAVDQPFDGFQQSVAYRFRQTADEAGEPVRRIRPRALMVPPGHPDFMSRARFVRPGPHVLEGRAWSGDGDLLGVEVSVDGGTTWFATELEAAAGPWAWRRWRCAWHAEPGEYALLCRAVAAEQVQPVDQVWNRGGFGNNAGQVVRVTCAELTG
jgi:DMSO/TMAO reductase YedYZ molybdopterin-dependent catalytic subunit